MSLLPTARQTRKMSSVSKSGTPGNALPLTPRLAQGTQMSKVVAGVKVRTLPARKMRTVLTMSPEALKLFALRYYLLGFGDTGRGFNGDTIPADNKAIRSILGVRFDRLYKSREDV